MTEEDLRGIQKFLSQSKWMLALNPLIPALEQKFHGFSVAYDGYWTRYRSPDHVVRCQVTENTSGITDLPECARKCWKLLMFRSKQENVETSVRLLLSLLKSGEIKSFKHNRDAAKPKSPKDKATYVIVIYTWGTEERDGLKAKLHSLGFNSIPYRRGCEAFEKRFGHWKEWFKNEK